MVDLGEVAQAGAVEVALVIEAQEAGSVGLPEGEVLASEAGQKSGWVDTAFPVKTVLLLRVYRTKEERAEGEVLPAAGVVSSAGS